MLERIAIIHRMDEWSLLVWLTYSQRYPLTLSIPDEVVFPETRRLN